MSMIMLSSFANNESSWCKLWYDPSSNNHKEISSHYFNAAIIYFQAQYIFIHDTLKEYILCGQTEIAANDIRKVIEDLSEQHDPCSAATGFEHQFQVS